MVCKPLICCPEAEKQPQSEWWAGAQRMLETCPGCCLGSRGGSLCRAHRFLKPELSSGRRRVCVPGFPVLCTLDAQTHAHLIRTGKIPSVPRVSPCSAVSAATVQTISSWPARGPRGRLCLPLLSVFPGTRPGESANLLSQSPWLMVDGANG